MSSYHTRVTVIHTNDLNNFDPLLRFPFKRFLWFLIFQTAGGAEEILQQFMRKHPDSNRDIMKSLRPDYISPLDDLAFDIYQVSSMTSLSTSVRLVRLDRLRGFN